MKLFGKPDRPEDGIDWQGARMASSCYESEWFPSDEQYGMPDLTPRQELRAILIGANVLEAAAEVGGARKGQPLVERLSRVNEAMTSPRFFVRLAARRVPIDD